MTKRSASVVWTGDMKTGKGTISTESRALRSTPYSFQTRFETQSGTNPEELIAAAHASCFSMAVAFELGKRGLKAESIEAQAEVSLAKEADGVRVTGSHLAVSVQVPGAEDAQVDKALDTAKRNCPISKLLNVPITLEKKGGTSPPLQATA
ncbi:MAG: OsmC family protein [Bacteriovoracia bacterium]